MKFQIFNESYVAKSSFPIKGKFKKGDWLKIDLSKKNKELNEEIIGSSTLLQRYIGDKLKSSKAIGAYGGYNEDRDLYRRSKVFSEKKKHRSIHLGVDFWIKAGTAVQAPLPGIVHSFANNLGSGNYGPTIILKHIYGNSVFFTLYGHLSKKSLDGIKIGQLIDRKQTFARLGVEKENIDWPPHLHFQIIKNIGENFGDYSGVCMKSESKFFLENSPDPILFFESSWQKKLGFSP